ncbi:MAG TPA: hypothetical protein VGG77_07255 [Roseiarcus sp.]|jgi:hypothetical protein
MLNLIRPDAFVAGGGDSGFDDVPVALVEIEHPARGKIGLLSKAHDHETDWHGDYLPN